MNWKFWTKKQDIEKIVEPAKEPAKEPRVWRVNLEHVANSTTVYSAAENYTSYMNTKNDKYKVLFWKDVYQIYPEIRKVNSVTVTQTRSGFKITEDLEDEE